MSLLDAIRAGGVAEASALLEAGADANEMGEGGETPLMAAAKAGQVGLVQQLLAHGADPSLTDETGETALLRAAAQGHRRVFELLAPRASEDERQSAAAYLKAAGQTHGPASEPASGLRTKLVGATARAAKFFGDETPAERVARVARAEKHRKR